MEEYQLKLPEVFRPPCYRAMTVSVVFHNFPIVFTFCRLLSNYYSYYSLCEKILLDEGEGDREILTFYFYF